MSGVIRRPAEGAPSFLCNRCDLLFYDGVHYEICPRCNLRVDWVDLVRPVWACPTCFRMVNLDGVEQAPQCDACVRPMRRLETIEKPRLDEPGPRREISPVTIAVVAVLLALPSLSLALDPQWRWLALSELALVVLVPPLLGMAVLVDLVRSWREFIELRRDPTTRVIHGFEHGTAHLLERAGVALLGGQTSAGRFLIFMSISDEAKLAGPDREGHMRRVADDAQRRIGAGEAALAYHPRCGSTWLAAAALISLAAVVMGAAGFLAHLSPGAWVLGAALGLALPAALTRPVGHLIQRVLSVSTTFKRAQVVSVTRTVSEEGVRYEVRLDVTL